MSADDAFGSVTICQKRHAGVHADDFALTVRHSASRAERFAWAEISRFAEKSDSDDGALVWYWVIVLRNGRKLPVGGTHGCMPSPETGAAIRQLAERYGIPAEVTGVALRPGLYTDPRGAIGLRYFDGAHWSPLLGSEFFRPRSVRKSPAAWPTLLMTEGRWTYAADRLKYWAFWVVIFTPVSAGLLITGLVIQLWWDLGEHHSTSSAGWFIIGGLLALPTIHPWRAWRYFARLSKAAKNSACP
jgi:hypothetical protein